MSIILVHCYSDCHENTYNAFGSEEKAREFVEVELKNKDFSGNRVVSLGGDTWGVYSPSDEEVDFGSEDWLWVINLEEVALC